MCKCGPQTPTAHEGKLDRYRLTAMLHFPFSLPPCLPTCAKATSSSCGVAAERPRAPRPVANKSYRRSGVKAVGVGS